MRREIVTYGCGGDRGKHQRHLGPHWKRNCGRDYKVIGTGAGQQKVWNESACGIQTSGTGQHPGVKMTPGGEGSGWGQGHWGSHIQGP